MAGGGKSKNEGRLEVYFNGEWGSVCNRNWGSWSGVIACKDLGFVGLAKVTTASHYTYLGSEDSPIWLEGVRCSESHSRIRDCPHEPFGYQPCSHDDDVGLVCSGKHADTHLK